MKLPTSPYASFTCVLLFVGEVHYRVWSWVEVIFISVRGKHSLTLGVKQTAEAAAGQEDRRCYADNFFFFFFLTFSLLIVHFYFAYISRTLYTFLQWSAKKIHELHKMNKAFKNKS